MPSALPRTRLPPCRRLLFASALLFAFAAPAKAGDPPWLVVHGEFFDIYTDASKGSAIDTAVWLEQFRRAVSSLWKIEPATIRRATVVRFRSEQGFREYAPAGHLAGYFANNDVMATMAFFGQDEEDSSRRLVQHECTHWLIGSSRLRIPPWVNEGLAELYATFEISGNTFTVFRPDVANLDWLRQNGVHSLRTVLVSDRDDIDYDNRERVNAFYAQSWAIVHYLLRGTDLKDGAARLVRYLDAIDAGQPPETAFQNAFGTDFAAMERTLANYARGGNYTFTRQRFERDALRKLFTAEPAPEIEVRCALAQLTIAGARDMDGAARRLRMARELDPQSPLPYEGLGCVDYYSNDRRSAVEQFREATARGSRNPFAIYLPASVELRDRLGSSLDARAVGSAEARRIADELRRALELNPHLGRAADEIGLALLFAEPLAPEDLKFLADRARLSADPPSVWYRIAGLLHRFGDREQARTIFTKLAASANPALADAAARDLARLDESPAQTRLGLRPVSAASAGPGVPRTRIEIPRR